MTTATESDAPQRQTPDALLLHGFWYRALPGDRVRRLALEKTQLLGLPLVVGRDQNGRAFALRDSCPHRGIPLSDGRFDGTQLECCYHGWKFDCHSGQCQKIPSLTLEQEQKLRVDRIYAGSHACEEHDGFIWVFMPEPGPAGAGFTRAAEPTEPAPRVPTFSEIGRAHTSSQTSPATSTTASLGLWTRRTDPSSIRPGGGGSATAFTKNRKTSNPSPTASACPRAHAQLEQRAV